MSPPPEINGPVWVVPMEAVRASLTIGAAATLGELIARGVMFAAHVRVEVGPAGFVALINYQDPASLGITHRAVLRLNWAPLENRVSA